MLEALETEELQEIRVKDVNRLEKNENENATRTLILTSLAAAAAGDGHPDDIKNNQEKGISTCVASSLYPPLRRVSDKNRPSLANNLPVHTAA